MAKLNRIDHLLPAWLEQGYACHREVVFRCSHFHRTINQLHTKTIQGHLKKCQSLGALQFAAGQLQLVKNITVVSEDVVSVLSAGIDLEVIVMSDQEYGVVISIQSATCLSVVLLLSQATYWSINVFISSILRSLFAYLAV